MENESVFGEVYPTGETVTVGSGATAISSSDFITLDQMEEARLETGITKSIIGVPGPEEMDARWFSKYPSVSDVNDYIPVHSLRQGDLYSTPEGNKLLFYTLDFCDVGYHTKKFNEFADNLFFKEPEYVSLGGPIRLTHPTVSGLYYSSPGKIIKYDNIIRDPTPLMLLTIKSSALYNIRPDNLRPEYFSLLIDRKFINDEDSFKVFRNIKKSYIDEANELVDIVYTNDITKLCFNSGVEVPQFKTFSERIRYASTINEQLFRMLKEV